MTELRWSEDVEAGAWIVERLHEFGTDVGSVVPDCFDGYARFLHPASRTGGRDQDRVRWSALAAQAGVGLGAETQFADIAADESIEVPSPGVLARDDLAALVGLLGGATKTPDDCWYAVWDGYGFMTGGGSVARLSLGGGSADTRVGRAGRGRALPGRRLSAPHRSYALLRGPVAAAATVCDELTKQGGGMRTKQGPNLWWPEDRAWCVASEIDLDSTYLGGTTQLVERILSDQRFEAVPVSIDTRITARQAPVHGRGE